MKRKLELTFKAFSVIILGLILIAFLTLMAKLIWFIIFSTWNLF